MIGIEDSGADAAKLDLFRTTLGVTYPLFNDPSQRIVQAFNVRATSTTFIISADFVVRERVENGTTRALLEGMWGDYGHAAP